MQESKHLPPVQKPRIAVAKPPWLRTKIPGGGAYREVRNLKTELRLNTVCEEARCPNIGECWEKKHATFMLLGHACTRACRFCDVATVQKPPPPDPGEPQRVAEACRRMGVRYAVITSVNRDDLSDGGAAQFAATVSALRAENPGILVELLIPDFLGNAEALRLLLRARPDVLGHNLETSRRLHPSVRSAADYDRSLGLLAQAKREGEGILVKSSFMVGLGETVPEIHDMLNDLAAQGVDIVHIGQYLRPAAWNLPVTRYVPPQDFLEYKTFGEAHGIPAVLAGPLVRSSYLAETTYRRLRPL